MGKVFIDLDGVIINTEELMLEEKDNLYPNVSYEEYFSKMVDWLEIAKRSNSINNSVEIIRELERLKKELIILTKVNSIKEMQDKIFYLRDKINIYSPIMFVPIHSYKTEVFTPASGDILVDDTLKNIVDWELAGGCGYLFNQPDIEYHNKVRSLEFLLKR